MFDAGLHANVIRRSHSRGSGKSPVFLDIVAAFALFPRSAINLLTPWLRADSTCPGGRIIKAESTEGVGSDSGGESCSIFYLGLMMRMLFL